MNDIENLINKICKDSTDEIITKAIYKDSHLPSYAIYPDNFPSKKKVPLRETAEVYYELFDEEPDKKDSKGSGESGGTAGGEGNGPFKPTIDDHSGWKEVEGDVSIQTELTKNMVERAASNTQKQRGNLPYAYSQMIENLTINREVNWKQVLRKLVGGKKANTRKTIMRRDRRQPLANWIKGKQKNRVFELLVIGDESGSVDTKELIECIKEILHICQLFDTPVQYIAIDTEAHPPTELKATTKQFERKACGGTILHPALEKATDYNIHYDAIVVITDNCLSTNDIEVFTQQSKPVIWLITSDGQEPTVEQNYKKHKAIKLKNQ